MFRTILNFFKIKVHKGWVATHRSGYDKQCIGCGERRSAYMVNGLAESTWWETTESGDGSCGDIKELPIRWH